MSCILQTKALPDQTYVHAPFKEFQHGTDAAMAEHFLNLGEDEVQIEEAKAEGCEVEVTEGCHNFADQNPQLWELARPLFRKRYFSKRAAEKPNDLVMFKIQDINVAVHIRHGDVGLCKEPTFMDPFQRCQPHNHTALMMLSVAKLLEESNFTQRINFQVFSEGSSDDFADLRNMLPGFEIGLNLNDDAFVAFHAFVMADILLTGHSSFSYVPALYNDNVVVYHDFWHKRLPSWLEYMDGIVLPSSLLQKQKLKSLLGKIRLRVKHPLHFRTTAVLSVKQQYTGKSGT